VIENARVVVINLQRRPDRLLSFQARFPVALWPGRLPERVVGLDGAKLGKPAWFDQQEGAWGCLRTHLRLIEDAIELDQDVLIFEDDVIFAADFAERIGPFLAAVPDDWDMVYLGGLHRLAAQAPPVRVNELVARARAVTTTYAYGLRASFLRRAYPLLLEMEQHHIDQMWARLMLAHRWNVYCPADRWLCGMDAGQSDICERYYATPRFWDEVAAQPEAPIHLVHLLGRKKLLEGVWSDEPLRAEEQRMRPTSTIGGWFTPECGEVYRRECVAAAQAGGGRARLVEVGCWRGRSLSYLADLIQSGDLDVWAVDTWQGNSSPSDPTHGRDVFSDFVANMRRLGIWDRIQVCREGSPHAAERFAGRSLDLVMIDADHEYFHVKSDLHAWWSRLVAGGVMMGHDYSPPSLCPDVTRAVDEFAAARGLVVDPAADMWRIRKPAV
jgi:SAM-dependent methyltransferase